MNPPNLQPTLSGSLLRLAPLVPADFDTLYSVARDPLIWEQHPDHDRYKPDVFAAFFEKALNSGGALLIRELAADTVVGSSRYYDWNREVREISIGYTFLARKCWGGEFNRDLKRLMIAHAFEFAERIWFHVGSENKRSRRAMEKIGANFSHEVTADPAWARRGMVYYCVSRAQWAGESR
jgi:RimJ/RimL family protein N-acetyltransferase